MSSAPEPTIRVLHVDTGKEWRGGQQQVLNLCRGLERRGIAQTLLSPAGSPLFRRASDGAVPVEALPGRRELDPLASRRLARIARGLGATVLHAHDAHAHGLILRASRHLGGATRLVVSRRVDFAVARGFLSRRKYRDPRIHFIAISEGVRSVLEAGGVEPERITVVGSGVDPQRFTYGIPRRRIRDELGLGDETPIIVNVGSLVDHKSQRYLVDAAPRILEQRPETRVVLVGEGPLRHDLEAQVGRLGLEDRVLFMGYRDDVETFLAGSDVFALSSHLEGLCTSIIDAMLLGLPVVGTNTGGVPDLVIDGKTGLLVPPRDPEALADAVLRLLEDRVLASRLAQAAREHVLARFTADAMVEGTLAVYRKLVAPR